MTVLDSPRREPGAPDNPSQVVWPHGDFISDGLSRFLRQAVEYSSGTEIVQPSPAQPRTSAPSSPVRVRHPGDRAGSNSLSFPPIRAEGRGLMLGGRTPNSAAPSGAPGTCRFLLLIRNGSGMQAQLAGSDSAFLSDTK